MSFDYFMQRQYIKFDLKVNSCLSKCISKSESYQQITDCDQLCSKGLNKFQSYVNLQIE